ncbi:MAG: hypothetical protein AB7V44_10970 [Pseudonocardia sp.]
MQLLVQRGDVLGQADELGTELLGDACGEVGVPRVELFDTVADAAELCRERGHLSGRARVVRAAIRRRTADNAMLGHADIQSAVGTAAWWDAQGAEDPALGKIVGTVYLPLTAANDRNETQEVTTASPRSVLLIGMIRG